jgi:uncharacterized protein (TIGR02996 family)
MPRRSTTSASQPRPEVLALLKESKERPEDDTPRLILADWLEEHGGPRGELVRIQCQLAGSGLQGGAREQLKLREAALLDRHRGEWLGVLAEKGLRTEFRRGLIAVWGPARKLLSKRLASLPVTETLAWVALLSLYDLNAQAMARLVASPHWTCLTQLDLGGHFYYADHLTGQCKVGMGPEGCVSLAGWPALSTLTDLVLHSQDIGAAGMAALAARSDLGRLRVLDLNRNNLRNEGAEALASCRSLSSLSALSLSQNRLQAEGIAALSQWQGLSKVTRLCLLANYPGAEGAAALAASPYLGSLTELDLTAEQVGRLPALGPPEIGPEGARALSRATGLERLRTLRLSSNGVGPRGAEALADSTLTALTELDLSDNQIGDEGVAALANSPALARLTSLDLRYNAITDRGARALVGSPWLSGLQGLSLVANREIGSSVRAALQERFGAALRM